jgi:hypothetical protein
MDFEKITTLVIVMIIWGISNTIRKAAQANQKAPAATGQKPGFREILRQGLSALQETGPSGQALNLNEFIQPPLEPQPPQAKRGPQIARAAVAPEQEPAITGRAKSSAPPPAGTAGKPRPSTARKKLGFAGMDRRELQNAVLWAEILAPPIALRDRKKVFTR